MNKNVAATIPGPDPPMAVMAARITIEPDIPAAPNNMSFRLPTFSMVNTAIQEARKYSVPFAAAKSRDMRGDRPISFSKI